MADLSFRICRGWSESSLGALLLYELEAVNFRSKIVELWKEIYKTASFVWVLLLFIFIFF